MLPVVCGKIPPKRDKPKEKLFSIQAYFRRNVESPEIPGLEKIKLFFIPSISSQAKILR